MTGDEILNHRKNKFLKIGRSKGFVNNPKSLSTTQSPATKFQEIFYSKKNIIIATISISILALFFALVL